MSEDRTSTSTGELRHTRIALQPLNPKYSAIELAVEEGDEGTSGLRVMAKLMEIVS
jgi:hypothetical protein